MNWRVKAGAIPPAPGMLDESGLRVVEVEPNATWARERVGAGAVCSTCRAGVEGTFGWTQKHDRECLPRKRVMAPVVWACDLPRRSGGMFSYPARDFRPDVTDPATAYLCLAWAAELPFERLPDEWQDIERRNLGAWERHVAVALLRVCICAESLECVLRALNVVEDV